MLSIGACTLCGKTEELLKRSHIIPDFMYAEVYDQDHRLNLFSPAQMARGGRNVRRPPTAPYDGGILCRNCDSVLLNGYEDYASKLLFGYLEEPRSGVMALRATLRASVLVWSSGVAPQSVTYG